MLETPDEVKATCVDHRLQYRGVADREVGWGNRIDEVLRSEAHPTFIRPIELGSTQKPVKFRRCGEICLPEPAVHRIARPRGVLETTVTLSGRDSRTPYRDPPELRCQARAVANNLPRPQGQVHDRLGTGCPRNPLLHRTDCRPGQQHVQRSCLLRGTASGPSGSTVATTPPASRPAIICLRACLDLAFGRGGHGLNAPSSAAGP